MRAAPANTRLAIFKLVQGYATTDAKVKQRFAGPQVLFTQPDRQQSCLAFLFAGQNMPGEPDFGSPERNIALKLKRDTL